MQSGLSHVMSIMLKEETKTFSIAAALQPTLILVHIKTLPLPPPHVPTPVLMIVTAGVGTLASALRAISTKVHLHSILNFKWKSPIYSSDANSIEGRYNGPDLPNEHISELVSDLSNSIDAPMNESKSELDSQSKMIVLVNHSFVFEWSGKSCTVNPFNDCLGSVKDVPIIYYAIAYDCP